MKKNNKITVLAIFAVIITIIALIATSGTYAKYTSSVDFTQSSATIARWKILVNGNNITVDNPSAVSFNLFSTISDTSEDDNTEEDVATGLIAPGTCGSFSFTITNESEVTARYNFTLTPSDNSIPIEYSIDNTNFYTASDLTTELNSSNNNTIAKKTGTTAEPKTITIYWRWPYEVKTGSVVNNTVDTNDTIIGRAETPTTYTVNASLVVTQVD